MGFRKSFLSISIICAAYMVGSSATLDEARALVAAGDFAKAGSILAEVAKSNPKATKGALFNYLSGVCEYEEGRYPKAQEFFESASSKGSKQALLYLGRLAFLDYDFDKAAGCYSDYRDCLAKEKAEADDTFEWFESQLESARAALGRVENIVVLDSVAVPAEGFFKNYVLPRSAGSLLAPEEIPLESHRQGAVVAFVNEGEDYMVWGEPDSTGNVRLVESQRLTDGAWTDPTYTPEYLNDKGYADYPFMMPDGVTLYFSSDGNDSMGGYDIFVVSRDAQTGEYLQPQNLGMPFNSPYDDYMLAIDEENGIGWWATDRNLLGDKVTIYIYKVNETRRNLQAQDSELIRRARISDFRQTQTGEEEEVGRLLSVIEGIDTDSLPPSPDFRFPVSEGKFFTNIDEFPDSKSRSAMKKYLLAKEALDTAEMRLSSLRRRFHEKRADNVSRQIIQQEKDVVKARKEVARLRNEVYKALK